jgi:predicted RNA-binding Zn-ribbon protein involved in translation (DUF1610 family)
VSDVERFFRRLVGHLAASDPARLRGPLPLDEISRSILPYRANRRALQLDTSEEYELVLLRLCAGEGGLVRTEPEEARARFAEESRSANPDLEVLREFEHVELTLRSEPLARALGPEAEAAYAPPSIPAEVELDPADEPGPLVELESAPEPEPPGLDALAELPEDDLPEDELGEAYDLPAPALTPAEEVRPACLYCGGFLPIHRPVNFCPHCGQSQTVILCPECRSELEPGWKHCVNCGAAVGEVLGG